MYMDMWIDGSTKVRMDINKEIRARKYLRVTVAYATCTMHVWLAAACPQTLIVTLGDVLRVWKCKKTASI